MENVTVTSDATLIISGIISLILIITFFVMAFRLNEIKKSLNAVRWNLQNSTFYEAQIADFKGNRSEAIDKYIDVLYLVTFTSYTIGLRRKQDSTLFLKEKIEKLGGAIPKAIIEKNTVLQSASD